LGACAGESIDFNGTAILAGNSQTFVYTAANGCDSTVLVTVAAYPAVNFDLMAEKTCWNASDGVIEVDILSGTAPFTLSLDNGNTQQSNIFGNLSGGNHSINVVDANGCHSAGSMEVPQTVPTQLLVNDAVLPCETGTVTLEPILFAENPSQVAWSWPDGSTAPTLTVNQEGRVEVTVDDGCEVIAKTIHVTWDEAYHQTSFFYVPNSFSPNYDGINDLVMAYPGRDFELLDFEFRVFDRWGDAMFVTKDIAEGWDGYNRNQVLQPGVFVWFIKAKVLVCGVREVDVLLKGDVSVMR
jgi:gliding motility-associated-like protein